MGINRPCPLLRRGALATVTALLAMAVSGSARTDIPKSLGAFQPRSSQVHVETGSSAHSVGHGVKPGGKRARRHVCRVIALRPRAQHVRHRRHHRSKIRRVRLCAARKRIRKRKPATPTGEGKAQAPTSRGTAAAQTSTSNGDGFSRGSTPRYIDSTFFGQHLEDFSSWPGILTPPWPVKAIRLWDAGVTWCDLNPAPNQYNWAPLDSWLAYAADTGADLVYTFGDTPGWAVNGGQGGCGSSSNLAPQASAWESFVKALLQHANGRIKYFELWNEWDSSGSWSQGVGPMVALADEAAPLIHGAHQGLMLLTPSVTPYDNGGALENFLASVPPSSGVIDVINVHTYTQSSQGEGLWPEATLYPWIGKVRNVMQRTGYSGYPLWSTEGSWGDNAWFTGYNDPSSQRAFVARYDLALLSLGLGRAYWYAYANPAWGTLWTATSGLTAAGIATNELVKWLNGATLVAPCAEDSTGLWKCDITRPGGYVGRILWVESGSVAVPAPTGYSTLRTLGGGSGPVPAQLTVSTEPVLIES